MNYADLFRVTLPETALEFAALLVLVVDLAFLRKTALRPRAAVASLLGVVGCLAAAWAIFAAGSVPYAYGNEILLAAGGLVTVAQIGIVVLTAVTLLLLIDSAFTRHVAEFAAVVLMAAAGGLLIASARDLLVTFVGLELLSLGLYILTAFAKTSAKSAESALKYYLFGGMSAAFLLFGFSYLYGIAGSTNFYAIYSALRQTGAGLPPIFFVALVAIAAGLGFKVAAVPFHLWAPDAYEGAPTPSAAFIASVSKVASFALLVGIVSVTLTPAAVTVPRVESGLAEALQSIFLNIFVSSLIFLLALASMLVGNLAALAQHSVRRLLAYSAIAHAGYILLGIAVGTSRGSAAVLYYILTYGLTTIGAFGVVDVVERATGSDNFDAFLGLHKRNPVLAAVLMVLFLSLAGIPPLVGFWAKFNLFAAVLGASNGAIPFALVALAVALSAVSLYYYLQVLKRAWVQPAVHDQPIQAPPVTLAVLVFIAAAVVLLGCFPSLLQNWIASF